MSNKKKEALPVKRYRFHFETIQNDAILYYERLLTWNILYSLMLLSLPTIYHYV